MGGYINSSTGGPISITNFGMPSGGPTPPQYVYTAASNINHNGVPTDPVDGTPNPGDGDFLGGPVPTGIIDDIAGTNSMDLSSWFTNHMIMDQNLGSANATGTGSWDGTSGLYDLPWTVTLTQGGAASGTVTWNLQGDILDASAVPEPSALWLVAISILGLGFQRRQAKK